MSEDGWVGRVDGIFRMVQLAFDEVRAISDAALEMDLASCRGGYSSGTLLLAEAAVSALANVASAADDHLPSGHAADAERRLRNAVEDLAMLSQCFSEAPEHALKGEFIGRLAAARAHLSTAIDQLSEMPPSSASGAAGPQRSSAA